MFAGRQLALVVALAGAFPASAAPSRGKEHVVSMQGAAFDPKELTVKPGETVVWKNDDIVAHTIKAKDGSFVSPEVGPDASYKWVAKKKGAHAYFCTLHPGMKGTITVR